MFSRYLENARRVVFFARYEAARFEAQEILAEHIVLGLLNVVGAEIFSDSAQRIRSEILAGLSSPAVPSPSDLRLSERSLRILVSAQDEADRLGDSYVSDLHILLGVLRMEECFAAEVLRRNGVTVEYVMRYFPSRHGIDDASAQSADSPAERRALEVDRQALRLLQLNDLPGMMKLYDEAISDETLDRNQTVQRLAPIAAIMARASGNLDVAKHYCDEQLACGPDNAEALFRLADCLARQGKFDEANEIARQSYNLTSHQDTPEHRSLADVIQRRFPAVRQRI